MYALEVQFERSLARNKKGFKQFRVTWVIISLQSDRCLKKSGIPIPAFLPLARKKRAVLEKKSDVKRVAPADHVGVDKPFVQTGFRHGLYTLGVKDH